MMAISKQGKYGTNPVVVMANSMLSVTVRYAVMVKAGGVFISSRIAFAKLLTRHSSLLISSNRFLEVMVEIISSCSLIFFR
jgi:hypothetical protein